MTTWWDPRVQRYRSTLPHKIMWVWGWPVLGRALLVLSGDAAHELAVRGLRLFGAIDRLWVRIATLWVIAAITALRLLAALPGFRWDVPPQSRDEVCPHD